MACAGGRSPRQAYNQCHGPPRATRSRRRASRCGRGRPGKARDQGTIDSVGLRVRCGLGCGSGAQQNVAGVGPALVLVGLDGPEVSDARTAADKRPLSWPHGHDQMDWASGRGHLKQATRLGIATGTLCCFIRLCGTVAELNPMPPFGPSACRVACAVLATVGRPEKCIEQERGVVGLGVGEVVGRRQLPGGERSEKGPTQARFSNRAPQGRVTGTLSTPASCPLPPKI